MLLEQSPDMVLEHSMSCGASIANRGDEEGDAGSNLEAMFFRLRSSDRIV